MFEVSVSESELAMLSDQMFLFTFQERGVQGFTIRVTASEQLQMHRLGVLYARRGDTRLQRIAGRLTEVVSAPAQVAHGQTV